MDWLLYKRWLGDALLSPIPEGIACPTLDQIAIDSRTLKKGDWFIPLKGENFDGHSFIPSALENGASGYFIKEGIAPAQSKVPYIVVRDTMQAYHLLASGWRASLPQSFQLVALTGSVGKTTAKTMTSIMLSHLAKTFSTSGNQNTEFSIPKAIFAMDSSYRYGVLEFGARHPGDIAFLTETAKPDVCVCLNVNSAHLEIFKSREAILKTKLEIISKSPKQSVGVVLRDNEELFARAKTFQRKLISFGYHPESSVCIQSEQQTQTGSEIGFAIHGQTFTLKLESYHQSYAINAAAALAVGLALELSIGKCIEGLSEFKGLKGRYQILKTKSGQIVIDDSYNASPESMKSGMTSVLESFPNTSKVLILGDMRELGDFTEEAHRSLAVYCKKLDPLRLITVGKYSKLIADECVTLGFDSNSCSHFDKVEELLKKLPSYTQNCQVIYIKGSNSIQLNKVVEELCQKTEN